jgi:hypothetical protein
MKNQEAYGLPQEEEVSVLDRVPIVRSLKRALEQRRAQRENIQSSEIWVEIGKLATPR